MYQESDDALESSSLSYLLFKGSVILGLLILFLPWATVVARGTSPTPPTEVIITNTTLWGKTGSVDAEGGETCSPEIIKISPWLVAGRIVFLIQVGLWAIFFIFHIRDKALGRFVLLFAGICCVAMVVFTMLGPLKVCTYYVPEETRPIWPIVGIEVFGFVCAGLAVILTLISKISGGESKRQTLEE